MTTYDLDDLYYSVQYQNRETFKRKVMKVIEDRGEMPEPKTAIAHLSGWGRRVVTIFGLVGGTAGLVIGDIFAWQSYSWPGGIAATAGAVALAGGTIWYTVDEYDNARHR